MEVGNQTTVMRLILARLTTDPKLQAPLFFFFLLVYIITVLDNIGIIFLYWNDVHLHSPMYFFISNLSFVDLCYSSNITPKMLLSFLVEKNVISLSGCATQLFFYSSLVVSESLLISVMAFDRYTAICKPLHYAILMTEQFCKQLAAVPYVGGVIYGVMYTLITFRLYFCRENVSHYFCDLFPLFKLSCIDTSLNEIIVYSTIAIFGIFYVIPLGLSYTKIVVTILRIHSSAGRRSAFSTCSSHLICVVLFHGTGLNMYLRPSSRHSDETDKVISIFYTIIIPMLNPLIYSLRNQDVKE